MGLEEKLLVKGMVNNKNKNINVYQDLLIRGQEILIIDQYHQVCIKGYDSRDEPTRDKLTNYRTKFISFTLTLSLSLLLLLLILNLCFLE